jgi:hypothetical protein
MFVSACHVEIISDASERWLGVPSERSAYEDCHCYSQ